VVGVVLVACSTAPLIGRRRSPPGVFAVTAASGVLLAAWAIGNPPWDDPLDWMGTDKFPLRGVSAPPRPP
jgi:hypothetical protein